jgi:carbon monoxide dehydrogenase subunit G
MRAFTFKEYIARSPQHVWDVLTDLSIASRWRPLARSMETEDGQPLRAGGRVRLTIQYLGREEVRFSTSTVFEPPRRWVLHSSDNPTMEGWFEFRLEPEGSGTRVIATCDLKAHGILPWLFTPLVARGERNRRAEMLGNLKRLIEGGGEADPSRSLP